MNVVHFYCKKCKHRVVGDITQSTVYVNEDHVYLAMHCACNCGYTTIIYYDTSCETVNVRKTYRASGGRGAKERYNDARCN